MDKDVLDKGVFFALQVPANVADPYPLYSRLRQAAPFHWDFVLSGWFLTRYADIAAALIDPRLTTANFGFDVTQLPPDLQKALAPLGQIRKREALYNDAPEHERLRRPLNRAFNPAVFERLRPLLVARAHSLLAEAERRGSMDIVGDYATSLSDFAMGELLGIPDEDRAQFISWCVQLRDFVTAPRTGSQTVSKARLAAGNLHALRAYVRAMIASRQREPADDLIGHMLAVSEGEAAPTEDEILANCVFFLHAGLHNVAAAISNGLLALLRHPDQFALLQGDRRLLSVGIEELLRYDPPLHVAIRGVREEMDFQGHRLGPKQLLILLLGAGNHDPEQFAEPDRLDLTRRPNRHVSFGVGPHGCVGAWLARFGVTIALEAILDRRTPLQLTRRKLRWSLPAMRRTVCALPVSIPGRPETRAPRRTRAAAAA